MCTIYEPTASSLKTGLLANNAATVTITGTHSAKANLAAATYNAGNTNTFFACDTTGLKVGDIVNLNLTGAAVAESCTVKAIFADVTLRHKSLYVRNF